MNRMLSNQGNPDLLTRTDRVRLTLSVVMTGAIAGALWESFDVWAGHGQPSVGSYMSRITAGMLGSFLGTLTCALVAGRFDFYIYLMGMAMGIKQIQNNSSILQTAVVAVLAGAFAGMSFRLYYSFHESSKSA